MHTNKPIYIIIIIYRLICVHVKVYMWMYRLICVHVKVYMWMCE